MAQNHSRLAVLLKRVEPKALLYMYMATLWRRHEIAELITNRGFVSESLERSAVLPST